MKSLKKMKHETMMTNKYLKDYDFTNQEIEYIIKLYEKEGINYCRREFNYKVKMNEFTLIPLEEDKKKECPKKARKKLIKLMKQDKEYQEKLKSNYIQKIVYRYLPISLNFKSSIY